MFGSGDIVGGIYQVIEEIGRGGTGVVYLAVHLNLRKYVVLKRVTISITDMESLRREADILKNLKHSNLPQIYDFVAENGEIFTVMDYIEGVSLDNYIAGGTRFSESQLTAWLITLSEVLVYLHGRHHPVIHSDIKPENIIITPQGEPVLIDFNISIDVNAPGRVTGYSMYYASPEQAYLANEILSGRQPRFMIDTRTDIYSLGAVFYTLVSGNMPDSRYELPRLSSVRGSAYSEAFLSVIDRCTAWDRNGRFRTAKKLEAAAVNLYRIDKTYRKYTTVRAAGWIAGALIFAAGCFCALHGGQLNSRQNMEALYQNVAEETTISDYKSAAENADKILGRWDYSRLLTDDQEAQLLRIIGEADYIEGKFGEAAEKYKEAAELAGSDKRMKGLCMADRASALIAADDVNGLQYLKEEALEEGSDQALIDIAEAAYYGRTGDTANCLKHVDAVLASGIEGSIKANACLIASDSVSSDVLQNLRYLRMATEYSEEAKFIRACAMSEYNCAVSGYGGTTYASNAVYLFEKLCRSPGASSTDRLNLGISCYLARDYQKCADCMKLLLESGSYKPYMYMALASDKLSDTDQAVLYCTDALEMCRKIQTPEADADKEVLEELYSRLK